MSQKFKGGNAKNARIKIDYSGKKPKVEFSYPSKKHGYEGSMLYVICLVWFGVFGMAFVTTQYIQELYESDYGSSLNNSSTLDNNSTPGILSVNGTDYNVTTYDGCVGYMRDRTAQLSETTCSKITSLNYTSLSKGQQIRDGLKKQFLETVLLLLGLFIPPFLIYFPFKKHWQNIYPKWMAIGKKKFTIFYPKDIKHTEEHGYSCELPIFKNVVLNYEATKEVSKYLEFIEIREHKFKYWMKKPKRKLRKHGKDRRRRDSLNEWVWYCRFYFKDKPKTGKLEVLYR